ncbi:MAG: hypothetical protein EMLJLAPB_00556 [Candidatus Argoarchaeum ethanivorans]|uniref:Uncharacterized protein n=1 Tax=Candidatus Argoarchaeum ethanivorans TaxID=2608793 RepID=A0A811TD10_9EURY|nr:MAG: hypothetical protein EMLJLAPB_00556 [Candidatus Argoarchaeum ethanivorans]
MNKEKLSARVIYFGTKLFAIFGYHTSRRMEMEDMGKR